jgi:hypothetical protein
MTRNKADIARVQVPVIMLELGREAALAVVCIAHAGNGSLRVGLAAGVSRQAKPGQLSVCIYSGNRPRR